MANLFSHFYFALLFVRYALLVQEPYFTTVRERSLSCKRARFVVLRKNKLVTICIAMLCCPFMGEWWVFGRVVSEGSSWCRST